MEDSRAMVVQLSNGAWGIDFINTEAYPSVAVKGKKEPTIGYRVPIFEAHMQIRGKGTFLNAVFVERFVVEDDFRITLKDDRYANHGNREQNLVTVRLKRHELERLRTVIDTLLDASIDDLKGTIVPLQEEQDAGCL